MLLLNQDIRSRVVEIKDPFALKSNRSRPVSTKSRLLKHTASSISKHAPPSIGESNNSTGNQNEFIAGNMRDRRQFNSPARVKQSSQHQSAVAISDSEKWRDLTLIEVLDGLEAPNIMAMLKQREEFYYSDNHNQESLKGSFFYCV